VNLVHKPKKTKQAYQHHKKEEADAHFPLVRQTGMMEEHQQA